MATTKKKATKKKAAKKKAAPKEPVEEAAPVTPAEEVVPAVDVVEEPPLLVPPCFPRSMPRAAQRVAFAQWAEEHGLDLKDPATQKRYPF